jgi:nitrilase
MGSCDLIVMPAAFTYTTGRAHWEVLLRARAIENQCYVMGVNRVGEDGKGLVYSGDSACIDLLGNETACPAGQETVLPVTLSRSELDTTRAAIPFLKDR